ncbi:hypothetical protein RRSWK_02147 [Rhodopirellula sp. SWK7]|nr:hypothetical protein RRSWK_02147 [Rhodopirellula sp. SWK7]
MERGQYRRFEEANASRISTTAEHRSNSGLRVVGTNPLPFPSLGFLKAFPSLL